MKFAVESWDPGYGRSVGDEGLDDPNEPVDVGVEVDAAEWRPLTPPPVTDLPVVYFVDGVRRTDAQVWVRPSGDEAGASDADLPSIAGVCATVAAGVVECRPGSARIVDARVERGFYTSAPNATSIITKHGTYELRPIVHDGDDPLNQAIHSHMTAVEHQMAADLARGLVVFDGPLRGRESPSAIGYVKTQHVQYLPPQQHGVVGRLEAGQRTPLFLIGGRYNRWSWYLRLPGPISHPLSGVVRVELPGLGQASDAADRADLISALLPRFASQPHKDARAPQNLHPIAGLERELRRRLGDQYLLERALRRGAG